jgi:hypothetical protein
VGSLTWSGSLSYHSLFPRKRKSYQIPLDLIFRDLPAKFILNHVQCSLNFLWTKPSQEFLLPTYVHTLAWLQVISALCSLLCLCSSNTSTMGLIMCWAPWFLFIVYARNIIKVNILPSNAWRDHYCVFFSISSDLLSILVHMLKCGWALDIDACKSYVNVSITNMLAETRGYRSLMASKSNFRLVRIFKLHRSCQSRDNSWI